MSLEIGPTGSPEGPVSDPDETWRRLDQRPGDRPELILGVVSAGMPNSWTAAQDQGDDPSGYRWLISHKIAWFGVIHDVPTRGPGGGCSLQAEYVAVDAKTGAVLVGGGADTKALDRWIARQPPLGPRWRFTDLPTTTTAPAPPPPQ